MIRWARSIAYIGKMKNILKILIQKHQQKRLVKTHRH
jgi:hypothetical protein